MKHSLLLCTINIIVGNGCGNFELIKNRTYRRSTLEADYRLSPSQIRSFFRPAFKKTV